MFFGIKVLPGFFSHTVARISKWSKDDWEAMAECGSVTVLSINNLGVKETNTTSKVSKWCHIVFCAFGSGDMKVLSVRNQAENLSLRTLVKKEKPNEHLSKYDFNFVHLNLIHSASQD